MRTAIISIALACTASTAAGADDPSRWQVKCGGPFQTCGYVEQGTSAPRIAFRYQAAKPFQDGLAPVRIDGLWGYIDRSGELAIKPSFADAAPFYGQYAEVRIKGAAGVIDRSGRIAVAARFKRIIPFDADVFIVVPLDPKAANSGGYLRAETDPRSLIGFGSAGLYHLRRGWITEPDLQFTTFDPARGLVWAGRRTDNGGELWGLMRTDGSWQVSPRYSYVQKLMGGRAIVRTLPDPSLPYREGRMGVLSGAVDQDGKLAVPLKYAWLGYWRGGYGVASRKGGAPGTGAATDEPNAGLVALDGTLVGGRFFDEVKVSEDGVPPRVRIGTAWHSVAPSGELGPDPLDGTTLLACAGGPSFIRRGSQVEVRRPNGEPVGLYDDTHFSSNECPGPYSLRRDGRWFILMLDGAVLGGDRGFENLYGFSGDSTSVMVDGKWGIIDRRGRFTVPPRFDELNRVGPTTYRVGRGDDARWIDAAGRSIAKPQPPRQNPATALACEGGLVRFQANGRWGLRDSEGNTVIRPEYRVLTCFGHGFAWAVSPEGRAWRPIGPDGRARPAFAARQEVYPYGVTHHTPERFAEEPFESSVLWNLALLDHLAGKRPDAPRWVPDAQGMASYSVMRGLPEPERADAAAGSVSFRTVAPFAIGISLSGLLAFVTWKHWRSVPRTDAVSI